MQLLNHLRILIFFLCLVAMITESMAQPHFVNKLPIPPLVDSRETPIVLEMRQSAHKFNPGMPLDSLNGNANQTDGINTFCYNLAGDSTMTVLGPTLKWYTGDALSLSVRNMLTQPTTTHWHGAEVPPGSDGGPHQHIHPGNTWNVNFEVLNLASTLWYHPHAHNRTVQQVQMGLSGMIIVEEPNDPIRNTLPHTYGVDDIPIIIGDMGLQPRSGPDDQFRLDTLKGRRPFNLVNGTNSPYLEVPAHLIRFRILNGSTRKGVKLGFSKSYSGPESELLEFNLTGTDGGYILQPVTMTTFLNGPGARDEIILDLSDFSPGDTLYMRNLKSLMPGYIVGSPFPPSTGGQGRDTTIGEAYLQLRIVDDNHFPGYEPITEFVAFNTDWDPRLQDTSDIAQYRHKKLVFTPGQHGGENAFTIDGKPFEMMFINDTVCVNTKEIWTIENTTPVAHPFHIHKIQFRILEIDSMGTKIDLVSRGFNGPKDDVLVLPDWKVRFLGAFDRFPSDIEPMNGYMYHCHILTHEDSLGGGMMAQFVVTDQGPCESTSIKEPVSQFDMELYPNPSAGLLYLKASSDFNGWIRILDTQGRCIKSQATSPFSGDLQIQTEGIQPGNYFVEWTTPEGKAIRNIVIQK